MGEKYHDLGAYGGVWVGNILIQAYMGGKYPDLGLYGVVWVGNIMIYA